MADQTPLHPAVYAVLGLVLLVSVFLFDLLQPLGVAAGVPYAALVMFGLLLHSRTFMLCMAVAGTALTLFGFYSQTPHVDLQIVATNRALAIFLIWTAAAIGLRQLAYQERVSQLEDAQNVDVLTGTLNRRGLFAKLDSAVKQARSNGDVLTVIVFDFDKFKRVNDCFGHLAGDAALQKLAAVLNMYPDYFVGRMGGEEFVLVMPNVSLSKGGSEAKNVLETIRSLSFAWQGQPVGLSLSAGVAALDDSMHTGFDLLRTADEALLTAKRKGGNRVSLAE
ncbi:MAG: GGDEF domain-containing protein [Gammaproteobacteria bacterium]|nr:GGDEF domain-containing protein [Gammaproteobacteria bacterium]